VQWYAKTPRVWMLAGGCVERDGARKVTTLALSSQVKPTVSWVLTRPPERHIEFLCLDGLSNRDQAGGFRKREGSTRESGFGHCGGYGLGYGHDLGHRYGLGYGFWIPQLRPSGPPSASQRRPVRAVERGWPERMRPRCPSERRPPTELEQLSSSRSPREPGSGIVRNVTRSGTGCLHNAVPGTPVDADSSYPGTVPVMGPVNVNVPGTELRNCWVGRRGLDG